MSEIMHARGGAPVPAGATRREGADGVTLARSGETTAGALAEQARTQVLARMHAARQWPRDWLDVRQKVLADCARPRFAETSRYSLPRAGKQIVGFTIRFAEACARAMGHVLIESPVIFEDEERRIVRVIVTDLESNATYSADVMVTKVMERRSADPRDVIGSRMNSTGQMVYLVPCTDADLAQKQGSLVSRAARTLILRLVPGDIQEEALERIVETIERGDADDPAAAAKKIADAFAALGVVPSALRDYLGHELAASSPAERTELRGLYAAIRDGHITWTEVLAERQASRAVSTEAKATGDAKGSKTREAVRAARAAKGVAVDAGARHATPETTIDRDAGELTQEEEARLAAEAG